MNVLETPPVPTLTDFRLSTRQEHLVQEIAGTPPKPTQRRSGARHRCPVASGVTTALLVLGGPAPRTCLRPGRQRRRRQRPARYQAPRRHAEAAVRTPPPDKTPGLSTGATQVSLVDTRGPFTLVLFGANTSTILMCVNGPSINSKAQANSRMRSIVGQSVSPGAGQIAVDRFQAESDDGQAYTIAEGSVGSGVTAATLVLSDGSHVLTTTGNGLPLPGGLVVLSSRPRL